MGFINLLKNVCSAICIFNVCSNCKGDASEEKRNNMIHFLIEEGSNMYITNKQRLLAWKVTNEASLFLRLFIQLGFAPNHRLKSGLVNVTLAHVWAVSEDEQALDVIVELMNGGTDFIM